MERVIFHIDINHCYAQIEEMLHPELKEIPMAVGGHEETRHGIILAKNDKAKKYHIQTGESLREAKKKCPTLLIIPPSYDTYMYYTRLVKQIYSTYSDCVESFGLDEAWIDYTHSVQLFGNPIDCAKKIQNRVLEEIGLTVSVGVSWNKIFAKLGSDMRKPFGFTVISKENYKDIVWPLPVEDLLYVGHATKRKLHARAIFTIGDLAQYKEEYLRNALGVVGSIIHAFANGNDTSYVEKTQQHHTIKSCGNSITMVHDVYTLEEIRPVMYMLCEAVASRLKDANMIGNTISITMRTSGLDWFGWEHTIHTKTNISTQIFLEAMYLLERYDFSIPLRAIGVSISNLSFDTGMYQMQLFENFDALEKQKKIDYTMDFIRNQFGFDKVRRASTLVDTELCCFNVKEEHDGYHPIGYFRGRRMKDGTI